MTRMKRVGTDKKRECRISEDGRQEKKLNRRKQRERRRKEKPIIEEKL